MTSTDAFDLSKGEHVFLVTGDDQVGLSVARGGYALRIVSICRFLSTLNNIRNFCEAYAGSRNGVGALIQRGGRAVAGMLTIATAGGS